MLWRNVCIVVRPFTRHNFKNSAVYSSCESLLSKATVNSDSHNATLETTENTSAREVEVRSSSVLVRQSMVTMAMYL